MATKLQDGNTPCLAATPSDPRPTVLVFDSGVGGLSVYNEIRQLLPDLHYIYAFDNVAFPYGEKSEEFIVERVVEIVTAVQQRYPLALAVIACNTASTVSLPALREKFAFPVVGVVPAIKPAARLTANGIVGLLATRGTVKRPYTRELIDRFANECRIEMLGSAELVELAEAKLHGEAVPLEELRRILRPWLRMQEPPDTVVLGCTHFPLWRKNCNRSCRKERGLSIPARRLLDVPPGCWSMKRRMPNRMMPIRLFAWRLPRILNSFYPFYSVMALKRWKNYRFNGVLRKKDG